MTPLSKTHLYQLMHSSNHLTSTLVSGNLSKLTDRSQAAKELAAIHGMLFETIAKLDARLTELEEKMGTAGLRAA